MASTRGRSTAALRSAPLLERLRAEPFRFEAGQALRVLWALPTGGTRPRVRLRSTFNLAFPASEVERVSFATRPAEMTVNLFGLGGAMGPLPTPFTELVNASASRGDFAPRDFVDIFNGRLVAAALDLERLYRPVLQRGLPQETNLAAQLNAAMGLGTPHITADIPDLAPALLPLAALINQRPVSAHAIERAVAFHFGVRTKVRQLQGAWLEIPAEQRTAIGGLGRNRGLGRDAVLGRRAWDQAAGVELELGPSPFSLAAQLIPGAPRNRELADLLAFMLGEGVEVRAKLYVEADTAPGLGLKPDRPPSEARLGLTAWLRERRTRPGRGGALATRFAILPRDADRPA